MQKYELILNKQFISSIYPSSCYIHTNKRIGFLFFIFISLFNPIKVLYLEKS